MPTNKQLNEKQSISLIQEMMEVSARNIKKDGILVLIWGVIIVLITFLNFFPEVKLVSKTLMKSFNALEVLLLSAGVLFTFYYIFINRKRVKTYVSTTARYTWVGILVVYNLVVVITKSVTVDPNFEILHPIQMCLIGLALFVTGGLYRERLLLIGGVVYWIAAVFAVRYRLPFQFIWECGAALFGFVIPGAWLFYQSRKNV